MTIFKKIIPMLLVAGFALLSSCGGSADDEDTENIPLAPEHKRPADLEPPKPAPPCEAEKPCEPPPCEVTPPCEPCEQKPCEPCEQTPCEPCEQTPCEGTAKPCEPVPCTPSSRTRKTKEKWSKKILNERIKLDRERREFFKKEKIAENDMTIPSDEMAQLVSLFTMPNAIEKLEEACNPKRADKGLNKECYELAKKDLKYLDAIR